MIINQLLCTPTKNINKKRNPLPYKKSHFEEHICPKDTAIFISFIKDHHTLTLPNSHIQRAGV